MLTALNVSTVEAAALARFGELGCAIGHRPHLAPGEPVAERESFGEVVQAGRLRKATRRRGPARPEDERAVVPNSATVRPECELQP